MSDVSEDVDRRAADLNIFLISLIADNTILYQTDKNSRNWSFRYYVENAEFRLNALHAKDDEVVGLMRKPAASEKDRWVNVQAALNKSIDEFRISVDRAIPAER